MSQSLWPEGKKSAAMFTFDLDGDIIWQNMSSDEPNTEKLIRARSIGQYGPNRCVDMILDLLDKYHVKDNGKNRCSFKKQRICISGFRNLWWTCEYMGLW